MRNARQTRAAKNLVPAPDPSASTANNANQHVWDYLKYYVSLRQPPQFAILIDGAWGIGKTYLIKTFLKEQFPEKMDYLYVSLYGLSRSEEIDDAILCAMYPVLANPGAQVVGKLAKGVLKVFKFDTDLTAADLLSKLSPKLYVFDDLERCAMPINEVLGYINDLVEHDGCKAVIVANEAEIADKEKYATVREKLIGKTLKIQSSLDEALAHFISEMECATAQTFVRDQADIIKGIYFNSGLNNLRLLRQSLWELDRVFAVIEPRKLTNTAAMIDLAKILLALSFELKAGRLAENDLWDRMTKLMLRSLRDREQPQTAAIGVASERYPDVEFGDTILNDETLVAILSKGAVNTAQINASLDQDHRFLAHGRETPWRTVWHFYERSDEAFTGALAAMEQDFANRKYTVAGEFLQVLGLRLWASGMGLLTLSKSDIIDQSKTYIDSLYSEDKLAQSALDSFRDDFGLTGWAGLGFFERESVEFDAVEAYWRQKWAQSQAKALTKDVAVLIDEMKCDGDLFYRRVTLTNSEDNRYYNVPILHAYPAEAFVTDLLAIDPPAQKTILGALAARYKHSAFAQELAPEMDWIKDVYSRLQLARSDMTGVAQIRMTQVLRWTLDKIEFLNPPPVAAARGEDI